MSVKRTRNLVTASILHRMSASLNSNLAAKMMTKSLQEQLISIGLIDKKKAKKITNEQYKNSRKQRCSPAQQTPAENQATTSRLNAERDRELNRKRQLRNEQKAVEAQVRQIVHANRLPKEEGEIAFNFVVKGKVKKIHISKETRDRISTGKLAIVEVGGQYELIPSSQVEKLLQRNAECVVFYNDPLVKEESVEDDYANHKIPDDLIW